MGCTVWSGMRGFQLNKMRVVSALVAFFLLLGLTEIEAQKYYGKRIGQLSQLQHLVKGEVYAVDSRTIHIKGFTYDGTAPDAFFYAGKSGNPSDNGIVIPDENGRRDPLGAYSSRDVTITLPDGMTLKDLAWLSIWCKSFAIDFGSLTIPRSFDYPRPQKIDGLPTFNHGVKSDKIVVVDAQTFLIPDFHYDGQAPDAFFWVGTGNKPTSKGVAVPDENGGRLPLKKYSGKTIVITLPDSMTVFDIDHFGVWCKEFAADFGHVIIPRNLNIPPSLKMLGVAPQNLAGHPNLIPSSSNLQLSTGFQGQQPFQQPIHPAPNSIAQPQNNIFQSSFVQPSSNTFQFGNNPSHQPQPLLQFRNPQLSEQHVFSNQVSSNFNSGSPTQGEQKRISNAELAFGTHRFSNPQSQLNQPSTFNSATSSQFNQPALGNSFTQQFNQHSTFSNALSSQFNQPSSFNNIPTSQFSQPSSFGNNPSSQINQPSSFGNVPTTHFNQPSLVGNSPTPQFNQPSSFGNIPSSQINQPSSFGNVATTHFNQPSLVGNSPIPQSNSHSSFNNIPSSQINQPASFGNVPTSQINQLSPLNNARSSQFDHQFSSNIQPSVPLNNDFSTQSNQHSPSFASNQQSHFHHQPTFGNVHQSQFNQPSLFNNVQSHFAQFSQHSSFGNSPQPNFDQHSSFGSEPSSQLKEHTLTQPASNPKTSNPLFLQNQFHSQISPKSVRDTRPLNLNTPTSQNLASRQPVQSFNSLLSSLVPVFNRQNSPTSQTPGHQFQPNGHLSRQSFPKTEGINHFTITDNRPSSLGDNNNFNTGIIDFSRNNGFRFQTTLQSDPRGNNPRTIRGDTLHRNSDDIRTEKQVKDSSPSTLQTENEGFGNLKQQTAALDKISPTDTSLQKDSKTNLFTVHRLEPHVIDKPKAQPVRRHQLPIISFPSPSSQSTFKSLSQTKTSTKDGEGNGGLRPSQSLPNVVSEEYDVNYELAPSSASFSLTSPGENQVFSSTEKDTKGTSSRIFSNKPVALTNQQKTPKQLSPSDSNDIFKLKELSPEHVIYNEESANEKSYSKVTINNGGHKTSYTIYA